MGAQARLSQTAVAQRTLGPAISVNPEKPDLAMARATFVNLLGLAVLVAVALQGCNQSPEPAPAPAPSTYWQCGICQHVYDPAADGNGAAFEDLPDDWKCPTCGNPKSVFTEQTGAPREVDNQRVHGEEGDDKKGDKKDEGSKEYV